MRIVANSAGGIASKESHHFPGFRSIGFINQPRSGIVGFYLCNNFVKFNLRIFILNFVSLREIHEGRVILVYRFQPNSQLIPLLQSL